MRLLRSELGFTQSELADALHVSFTTINRWENGKSVPSSREQDKINHIHFCKSQYINVIISQVENVVCLLKNLI